MGNLGSCNWLALICAMVGGAFYLPRHSEAYELAVSNLQASTEAANVLGTPISTGLPSGSISIEDTNGSAILSFSATGTKAAGRVLVEGIMKDGVWSLTKLTLTTDGRVIDLVN